jgi:hypothetical protein
MTFKNFAILLLEDISPYFCVPHWIINSLSFHFIDSIEIAMKILWHNLRVSLASGII